MCVVMFTCSVSFRDVVVMIWSRPIVVDELFPSTSAGKDNLSHGRLIFQSPNPAGLVRGGVQRDTPLHRWSGIISSSSRARGPSRLPSRLHGLGTGGGHTLVS